MIIRQRKSRRGGNTYEIGLHTQFVGEILDVKVEDSVCDGKGHVDIEKVKPMLFDRRSTLTTRSAGFWVAPSPSERIFEGGRLQRRHRRTDLGTDIT